jgi:hypothetical protein
MAVDLRGTVVRSMAELKKEIADKATEVVRLKRELKRHQQVLALLAPNTNGRSGNGRRRKKPARGRQRRGDLNTILERLPKTFESKNFIRAGIQAGKTSVYLRQVLSRWARTGKIKRMERGKYQKIKRANGQRLAA